MAERVARLVQAVQELSLAATVDDVQRIVRTSARALAGSDGATFVLRDGGSCFYADEDAIAPLWKGLRFPLEACISGWSMLHREPVVIPDIYLDARIPHDAYRPTFVKSLVMVPIRRLDPLGAIGNYWSTERQATEEEVALLQALADSTSVALERVAAVDALAAARRQVASAEQDAGRDDLTGLANRRGFHLLAGQALESVRRDGLDAAVLFIDLDGLKAVNDRWGHAEGDRLIGRTAAVLREALRGADVVARLGGDEFVVLCTGRGVGLEGTVDRLRAAMAATDAPGQPPLRASIGAAPYEPGDTVEGLLARADTEMYLDKARRRQRVPAQRQAPVAPQQPQTV